MDFSSILFLLTISIIIIFLFQSLLKFFFLSNRQKLPLPPGSLGYAYIGETFQLYSQNPNVFFAAKQKKYGSTFKTHILGCPCVMISSPEAAKFVLVTRADLFKPTFPASKERMLGRQAIFFHQGEYHAKLRKLVLRAFVPEAIKTIVSDIESIAKDSLQSWEGRLVNTFQEMKTYTFNAALLSIFGKDEVLYREDLKRCYYILEKGYNSMPINLPGTLFHKAMRARKELAQILAKILATRRQMKLDHSDLLGSFMGDKEGLTDEQIADNIIGVIFAACDTTASVLTWILKYLGANPSVLQAVNEGQVAIIRSKEKCGEEKLLTWAETKKMPITTRVVQETRRVASILSFTFREAVEDVEYEGYLIPKGGKVLPLFRNIHHSPENFPDPEKFNPSRFEVSPKPNTLIPFGNGTHSCLGNELTKMKILVLLHHKLNVELRIEENEVSTRIEIIDETRTLRAKMNRRRKSRSIPDLQSSWPESLRHWLRLDIRIMQTLISKKTILTFIIATSIWIFILTSTKSSFVAARVLGSEKTMNFNPDYKGPITPSGPNPCSLLPINDPRHCNHP